MFVDKPTAMKDLHHDFLQQQENFLFYLLFLFSVSIFWKTAYKMVLSSALLSSTLKRGKHKARWHKNHLQNLK